MLLRQIVNCNTIIIMRGQVQDENIKLFFESFGDPFKIIRDLILARGVMRWTIVQ